MKLHLFNWMFRIVPWLTCINIWTLSHISIKLRTPLDETRVNKMTSNTWLRYTFLLIVNLHEQVKDMVGITKAFWSCVISLLIVLEVIVLPILKTILTRQKQFTFVPRYKDLWHSITRADMVITIIYWNAGGINFGPLLFEKLIVVVNIEIDYLLRY